ncbi:MAG: Sorbitol dehydrogenase [Lentisphaerae bacterium ADurb.Bin242]|nr:MAG: Sorbitol dehydrogenase [Lentisphaerae bacterium ADurb.Bin242]
MRGKQILFTDVGKVETLPLDFEEPGELFRDDVLLQTEYTLVSPGTEMDCLFGRTGGNYPKCLGYSATARVLKCGEEVSEFQAGDRVLVYHSRHASFLVKNKSDLVKVPEGLAPEEAVFAVVGSMGLQGLRKIRPELGESVMVMGLGLLGMIASQCAARSGAFPLITLDFNPFRRDLSLQLGADHSFSPDTADLAEKVKALSEGGVPAVVEATGAPDAINLGLKMMSPLGRIALVGCSRTPTERIDFYQDVHRPGIQIIGAHNFVRPTDRSRPGYWTMRDDMSALMKLIRAGRINTRKLITEIAPPERAPAMYRRFIDKDPGVLGVIFDWREKE